MAGRLRLGSPTSNHPGTACRAMAGSLDDFPKLVWPRLGKAVPSRDRAPLGQGDPERDLA
jgi:hypothetical protein